jgi:hypothetical protein
LVAWSEAAFIGATNRSCPKCNAEPLQPCITSRGPMWRRKPMNRYHTERYTAGLPSLTKERTT